MPSKGVDFYGFVAKGFELEIRKADAGNKDKPDVVQHISSNSVLRFFSDHYEINTNAFGLKYEGRFQFIARKDGRELYERSLRINANTGNIDNEDIGNIRIPARVENDYCLSFGLYDADSSNPNAHQIYATLTPNRKTWQSDFFRAVSDSQKKTLSDVFLKDIFLPGSHDAGMYTDMLTEAANMANTQHHNISKQLELGARYFDFRPGKLCKEVVPLLHEVKKHKSKILGPLAFITAGLGFILDWFLDGKINDLVPLFQSKVGKTSHIHAVIPGESYYDFIRETVSFLEKNKEEIVVINIADSGILRDFEVPDLPVDVIIEGQKVNGKKVKIVDVPSKAELEAEIQPLLGSGIKIGSKASFNKSIRTLLDTHERLIILYREEGPDTADTYGDDYVSYDKNVVTKAVKKLLSENNDSKEMVKLQLQLTPTGVPDGIARAIKGTNKCTTPLYATKPRTDLESYRLLLEKADDIKSLKPLTVAQNDFYDNALTEIAVALNEYKAGLVSSIRPE